MTTHPRRWPIAWRGIGAVVACMALALAVLTSPARAQPFAATIMDVRTGEYIWQTDNANSRIHPASLTKMMTLYIVFEAIENGEITLDTQVRISRHAAAQPPSRLGLRAGQTIALRYLIRAAALRSGNDAAVALAEAIEGSVPNFAARMNRTAAAIGMTRTRFVNPHGLTAEGHLSSARDMSRLGRQLFFDFPQYYGIFSRRSEDAGIATVANTNGRFLDSYRGADGIKTGFTNAAGYNLTAMAERDGVRILVTVMGARSGADRLRRVTELMDRGFREAPRRATTRRPARPDYVRAPEDRGSGVSAGRTIRLQTAPIRSRFPRPRPAPGEVPSDEMLASLRNTIDEMLDEIREPDPSTDTDDPGVVAGVTSEEPEEILTEPPVQVAAAAPATSLVPRMRPGFEVVSRAGSDASITPITDDQPPEIGAAPESATVSVLAPLPVVGDPAAPESEMGIESSDAADAVAPRSDGSVVIPGLPPIAAQMDDRDAPAIPAAPAAPPPEAYTGLEPVSADLRVDDDGRILWRDEELLAALRASDPASDRAPDAAPAIVLTTSASTEVQPRAAEPMPEIIGRVATSGGRLYRVELGAHASRFDAERTLLRLALSESATLGSGERRVSPRGGRFVAEVTNLEQDEAELACARLSARDQACTVVAP